jgi:Terpene cyclase DEP1
MAPLYLALAIIGAVAPYAKFVPWLMEGRRGKLRLLWMPISATCLIGVSCGLPLFLYLRERQMMSERKQFSP